MGAVPCGFLGTEAFFFLFLVGKIPAWVTFLEFQRADSNNCSSTEEQPRTHLSQDSVQWLSPALLFATPWTAAHQASLSFTKSRSLLKLTSIELVRDHPTISSSFVPFSSRLQSCPASGSSSPHQVARGLEFQLQHQSFP